ncbi:MAG: SAM-dependent methyltransferase [Rhodospirillales bacterium]|nr:SAM-dependent methyltransferase [Rhodospirillales bacterium]
MIAEMIVLGCAFGAVALIAVVTLITGAPPMPTAPRVKLAMISLLPEELSGAIHELGSGWGGLALALAAKYPHTPVFAYELSPIPWLVSRFRLAIDPRSNLEIRLVNFLKVPFADAGLVVCYLNPRTMQRVKSKLEAELAPGTLILCNTFSVPGWTPIEETQARDMYRSRVYLYRK